MTSLKTTEPVDLSKFDMSSLIREANSNHYNFESVADEVDTLRSSAIGYALCSGAALAEVKSRLKHGEWLSWLRQNFEGSEDTAQNYMRLYDRQVELPNTEPVRHFGVKEALKLLASPKPKPEQKPRREPQLEADDAPAEVIERRAAPISQEPGVIVSGLLRYLNNMHERWPEGKSRCHVIACLRQAADKLEKIEAQNAEGGQ